MAASRDETESFLVRTILEAHQRKNGLAKGAKEAKAEEIIFALEAGRLANKFLFAPSCFLRPLRSLRETQLLVCPAPPP